MNIRYFVILTATLLITASATILILNYAGCLFCVEQGLAQANSEEEQQQPFWTSGSRIPEPSSESAAVLLNERIYLIGGLDANEEVTDEVKVYDIRSNSWSAATSLPTPLDHSGVAAYDGKIYLVGGFLEDKIPTDRLFIYDPQSNRWDEGETLPEPRGALTANFIDGILYAVGGVDSSHTPVSTNEAYNPATNKWTEKAPMPTARHHLTSEVVEGKLYVIGGRLLGNGIQSHINEALSNFNDNEVYDPKKDTWNNVAPMPTKRSGLASASFNGSIYLFGGQGLNSALNNTEKYDPKANTWSKELPVPNGRLGLEAVSYDNKIYVIGGKTDIGPHVSDLIEIFHLFK